MVQRLAVPASSFFGRMNAKTGKEEPMFISIHDLALQKLEFSEPIPPGKLDLGSEITQKAPIHTQGHAELVEEHHGGKNYVKDIRVVGSFDAKVELRCARCLEPVPMKLSVDFDLLYRPMSTVKAEDEVAIHEGDTEIGYYQGDGILLEDVLKEQVILSAPLRALCKEDCKGLCPQCGANKNSTNCECIEKRTDPRWNALAEMKNMFKN
jgi:uncharacterized protein